MESKVEYKYKEAENGSTELHVSQNYTSIHSVQSDSVYFVTFCTPVDLYSRLNQIQHIQRYGSS